MIVNDLDRPDVHGVLPKMHSICDKAKEELLHLTPYMTICTDDNIMSSVTVRGTKESKDTWQFGIFENAGYFTFLIKPMDDKRYYDPKDDKVTVELVSKSYKLPKFRKYTGPLDKVLLKIKEWVQQN